VELTTRILPDGYSQKSARGQSLAGVRLDKKSIKVTDKQKPLQKLRGSEQTKAQNEFKLTARISLHGAL
jgi:hypothetical protein